MGGGNEKGPDGGGHPSLGRVCRWFAPYGGEVVASPDLLVSSPVWIVKLARYTRQLFVMS